ncbi:MAG TPA: hypothetical protein VF406_16990 [Thermodesulfobacteriota bacterium]
MRLPTPGAAYPIFTAGERACPLEDCGGAHRYFELLEIPSDPTHEERDEVVTWTGGAFDPEAFDLSAANARLRGVR